MLTSVSDTVPYIPGMELDLRKGECVTVRKVQQSLTLGCKLNTQEHLI